MVAVVAVVVMEAVCACLQRERRADRHVVRVVEAVVADVVDGGAEQRGEDCVVR